jgi:alkylation response protein AidB-like acyl-CoA dehydrogenase
MDVKLNADQIEIARQARRFLEKECPVAYVRAMLEEERGFTDAVWNKMVEMGWTAMRVPEAYGGVGLEFTDMAVLLEEMGRAALPGPFFSSILLAAETLMECGNEDQKDRYLHGLAAGEMRGTLALYEPDSGADFGYIRMKAVLDGQCFVLDGQKLFVPDAHVADFVIVAARTENGSDKKPSIGLFLVDLRAKGVSIDLLPTMDGTRKLCAVEFKSARVEPEAILGSPGEGWEPLRRVVQRAQVGLAAECVGGGQRALEMATDYAKIRIQFDQPIGSFQAIKHRCARMFEEVESARSLVYWAAWAQEHADSGEAALAASAAKAYCSEVYSSVTTSAVQVLGGTGFSWEHDIHLYLKRAKANEAALGDPAYHREQVALILAG